MLGTEYFLKIAKINSQHEKPICPIVARISSRKTQKIANPQILTPAKISCHTVSIVRLNMIIFFPLNYQNIS